MLIAWDPKIWWNFCMSDNEERLNKTNFYRVMPLVSIQFESIEN